MMCRAILYGLEMSEPNLPVRHMAERRRKNEEGSNDLGLLHNVLQTGSSPSQSGGRIGVRSEAA